MENLGNQVNILVQYGNTNNSIIAFQTSVWVSSLIMFAFLCILLLCLRLCLCLEESKQRLHTPSLRYDRLIRRITCGAVARVGNGRGSKGW